MASETSWFRVNNKNPTLLERWGHSGVYFDGKLYIYGSSQGCRAGVQFSDVLVLDLETMLWKELVTTGQQPGARDSHTAVLYDQKMIVFGGTSGSRKTNEVHVLDLKSLVWSRPSIQGSPPAPRESHTKTMISGSHALVFGGSGDQGNYLDDIHILDCENMKWTAPRVKGYSPVGRDSHTSVIIRNALFLYGGDCGDRYSGDVDVLDLDSFTWSKLENVGPTTHPGVRAGHTAVAVGRKMCIFGGVGDRTYYKDVWLLDVEMRVWSRHEAASSQLQGRFSHVAVLVDNSMAVYGGCGEDEKPLEEFLVLSVGPKSGLWSKINEHRGSTTQRSSLVTRRFLRKEKLLPGTSFHTPVQKKRRSLSKAQDLLPSNSKPGSASTLLCSRNQGKSPSFRHFHGIEVHGIVDGVFDSGYLMTAHLNGQVLRGFLFNPDYKNEEKIVATRGIAAGFVRPSVVMEQSCASKRTDNDERKRPLDEEQVTLSLATNHTY